jgi:hypothetical protein
MMFEAMDQQYRALLIFAVIFLGAAVGYFVILGVM